MEALQMLKFALKKERLNFTKGWQTTEFEMTDEAPLPNDDILAMLLSDDKEGIMDAMDAIIRSFGEADAEADNDGPLAS